MWTRLERGMLGASDHENLFYGMDPYTMLISGYVCNFVMYITCTEKLVRVSVVSKIVFIEAGMYIIFVFLWSCPVLVCLWRCYVYNCDLVMYMTCTEKQVRVSVVSEIVFIKDGMYITFVFLLSCPDLAVVFLPSKMLKLCRPINKCSKMIFLPKG